MTWFGANMRNVKEKTQLNNKVAAPNSRPLNCYTSFTVGSLFSGIGLLDYGLEQSGMKTLWQVEYDDWCRERLAENFPHTEKYKDVREVGKHNLEPVKLICGGFPCQDLSVANTNGKGLNGERSGLWFEMFRVLCELRPKYALIENVPNLLNRGLDRILSDLASVGYDAEWQTLRASAFGLPQTRKRLFIVAYAVANRPAQQNVKNTFRQLGEVNQKRFENKTPVNFTEIGMRFVSIPKHLRLGDGRTFEFSEIERAVKGFGNGVVIPCAEWIGRQILQADV